MTKAKPITLTDPLDVEPTDADLNQIDSPEEQDMHSAAGTNPAPTSDDDIDVMTDEVGLYHKSKNANEKNDEVGIANQVQKAEQRRRGIDDNTFSDE